jgi:hypothetical protein
MALTALTIPSQPSLYKAPYDALTAFTSAQTITATGYLNNLNSGLLDLGGSNPVSAAGRTEMLWTVDITAVNMVTTDEFYRFALLGSNDGAFGNGNVELLDFFDIAALTANRQISTILGASPAIPPSGRAGTLFQRLVSNLQQEILYRYVKAYVVVGGTSPSVTVTSWLSKCQVDA